MSLLLQCCHDAVGILQSGYWPDHGHWRQGWATPARCGTARIAADMVSSWKSSTLVSWRVSDECQEIGECPACPAPHLGDGLTQEAALRLGDVRTSGWKTEMRISSAKGGHKPATTAMWLEKGQGFELRRLLMRRNQCSLFLSAQTHECSPIHWFGCAIILMWVLRRPPHKTLKNESPLVWWSKSHVLLSEPGPGDYMIGKHRVHLQVLGSGHWSQYLQLVCLYVHSPLPVTEMGNLHTFGWVSTSIRFTWQGWPASFQAGPGGTLLCSDGEKVGKTSCAAQWTAFSTSWPAKVCRFAILMFLTLCCQRLVGAYVPSNIGHYF